MCLIPCYICSRVYDVVSLFIVYLANLITLDIYVLIYLFQDGPDTNKSNCQSRRAASICFSAIKFASSLKNESVLPDSFRGKPLCMDQFRVCLL